MLDAQRHEHEHSREECDSRGPRESPRLDIVSHGLQRRSLEPRLPAGAERSEVRDGEPCSKAAAALVDRIAFVKSHMKVGIVGATRDRATFQAVASPLGRSFGADKLSE